MEGAPDKVAVSPNGNAPAGSPQPPPPKRRRKINWKVILTAAVAVIIIQQLVSHLGSGKPASTGTPASPASSSSSRVRSPKSSPSPVPTVTLNGHGVASGSGPIVVLNPGLVAPGGQVGISGTGFDPRATVTVLLRTSRSKPGAEEATAKVGKDGSVTTMFTMPADLPGTTATVVLQEGGSSKAATAQLMTASGTASVTIIGKAAGKPGNTATISATGFGPGEKVKVYWGRIGGTPATTLTADGSGSIGRAQVPVGVAPVGPTTIVLVGKKTHTMAVAPYQMLGLYPTTGTHPYALKAGNPLSFSGGGFAPGEQVLIYLNASGGTPALTATADGGGSFNISFVVPFGLNGTQTLTAIGEQSRASVSGGFDVLPYTPSAQASTYSALPGTTLSFYVRGFAPGEQVTVYTGSHAGDRGQAVTAFHADNQGDAAAAGRYVIPTGAGPTINFTLVGQKSGGVATAKVSVGSAP